MKNWLLMAFAALFVLTGCDSEKASSSLGMNYREIMNGYHLQKEDYFTEYYLVKVDEDGSVDKVLPEPVDAITWKGDNIYVSAGTVAYLRINTAKPLPKFLQNSTTEASGESLDFELMKPHQAWERLLSQANNRGKYMQFIIGITVIVVLVFAIKQLLKHLKENPA